MDDLPTGRYGNHAQREEHEEMDDDDKPLVTVYNHLGNPDERIITIDHLQFGGAITTDELRALNEAIEDELEGTNDE